MIGLITDTRLARIISVPVSAAQTELRAGSSLLVATVQLQPNQHLEVRGLCVHVVKVLTSGVIPARRYEAFGNALLGIYQEGADCTPLVYATTLTTTAISSNPFRRGVLVGPASYRVLLKNNTLNVDLSVSATGSLKLYF